MKCLSFAILILLLATSCASIKVQTRPPYQSKEFNHNRLKTEGVALLPSLSKEFDSIILQSADAYLRTRAHHSYLQPRDVAQILNATNTLLIYREAVETYNLTGVTDREKFKHIGAALDVRYLIKIDPGVIKNKYETESSSSFYDDDIDIESTEIRENTASAIIIDCSNGEIVWEALSKSTLKGGRSIYNQIENHEIVKENISGLMERLFQRN